MRGIVGGSSRHSFLAAPASQPVAPAVCPLAGVFAQQAVERPDHAANCAALTARVACGIYEHETVMSSIAAIFLVGYAAEVGDVLRDHGPALFLGTREELDVPKRTKLSSGGHGVHVLTFASKLLSDAVRVHLVQQEPQAIASWARSEAMRRRSASLRL